MRYAVAVRALCEFTAKQGDLDARFTPAPTAQQGIAGHTAVTARRGAGYESEISLQCDLGQLSVRGRADGYDPALNQLEEIKTHRGDLSRQPANHRYLHWAQLKIYGWLLCQARGLPDLTLALVYYDIASQQETVLTEHATAQALRLFFEAQCGRFLAWARQELAHRTARDLALGALRFPHPSFRPGQRALAEAVYRCAGGGRALMAQAPTGIGKTVATIFPLLKACPARKLDKLFYLAAKTPGRQLALDALALIGRAAPDIGPAMQDVSPTDEPAAQVSPVPMAIPVSPPSPLPLRVLELTARDKACEHPDKACHGDSCPLAEGFYDKLPAARTAVLQAGPMDRALLRTVALEHGVCPYYLGQDLVRWADVVVADYNYYFDASAMLYALTVASDWRVALLVDEAHNLVERGRDMYTAQLHRSSLRELRRSAPAQLTQTLAKLDRCWEEIESAQETESGEKIESARRVPYQSHDELPARFITALQHTATAIADHLAESPAQPAGPLQNFYFCALQFNRLAESFGDHSLFDTTLTSDQSSRDIADSTLCIRNLIPAPFLGPRFASAASAVLFSATLGPQQFYRDMLGLAVDAGWVEVESPFQPEQLQVRLVRHISTRFPHRQRSAQPIAQLIAQQYQRQPGNYLAFFSSFDYLEMVAASLGRQHPEIPAWEQSRRMQEPERRRFLARFQAGGRGIGFAVLGGSFAEGIDLPGDRLIGAFIATLGLPQINPVNEQLMLRMDATFGAGYDYAYLYPGIRKVVQAAGRVIRTREDRGVVVLIDDRFARPAVRSLLPAWWNISVTSEAGSAVLAHPLASPPGHFLASP